MDRGKLSIRAQKNTMMASDSARFLSFADVNSTQTYIANLESQLESWVSFGSPERIRGH